MPMFISVNTRRAWAHCWPGASGSVEFLKNLHRHVFHIKVEIDVTDPNREIEFFTVQSHVDQILDTRLKETQQGILVYSVPANLFPAPIPLGTASCEHVAADIYHALKQKDLPVIRVTVAEDGENSATIESYRYTESECIRVIQ